jgi:hypothetical protein
MGLKDLPNSLVTAVAEVVSKSAEAKQRLAEKILDEAILRFGVTSVNELTEHELKTIHDWVQNQYDLRSSLFEATCGCDSEKTVSEDDMPGDASFHKDGDESAEKKKEIDEEDSEDALKESVALFADEIATNGAVAVGDASLALPKHADVIRDSSPLEGTHEYRLLIQFVTNEGTQIVPPTSLPGSPTVSELRTLVAGLPYYNEKIEDALLAAEAIFGEAPLVSDV